MSDRLKKSLSEVLTEFYPVAGKLNDDALSIHCNDQGLDYIEARVKAPLTLSQLVNSPQAKELNHLLPYHPFNYGTDFDSKLSAVQITVFDHCGGMAIGVCISHVVADGFSLAVFLNSWAAIVRGDAPNKDILSPKFGMASLFPPRDKPVLELSDYIDAGRPQPKLVTKRFVFDRMNIDSLKANFHTNERPTRVEAVSALILKCLINVAKSKSAKPIVLGMPVGIRWRMNPPLPMHYFGNLALPWTMQHTGPGSLSNLGTQIKKSIKQVNSDSLEKLQADGALLLFEKFTQWMALRRNTDVRFFQTTSLCNFPFHEVDVSWGVPAWVASVYPYDPDAFTLIDTVKQGGIEAWVTLDEDDMLRFQSDKTLLTSMISAL